MNVTDEQKEKLKCKIEGRERNLRRERVIKAVRPEQFLFWAEQEQFITSFSNYVASGFFHQKVHSVSLLKE